MKANGPASISAAWRIAALVVLVLWTAGMAVCMAHCALGTVRLSSIQLSCNNCSDESSPCHGNGASGSNNPQSGSPTVCYTLKHLFADGPQPLLSVPEMPAFGTAVILEALALANEPLAAASLHQHHLSEWVFTPEVSLGPALRALAPPSIS